jgi:hypothetical protein
VIGDAIHSFLPIGIIALSSFLDYMVVSLKLFPK